MTCTTCITGLSGQGPIAAQRLVAAPQADR